jgi:hypothetical protein
VAISKFGEWGMVNGRVGCKANLLSKCSWLTPKHDAKESINSNPPQGVRMIGGLGIQ